MIRTYSAIPYTALLFTMSNHDLGCIKSHQIYSLIKCLKRDVTNIHTSLWKQSFNSWNVYLLSILKRTYCWSHVLSTFLDFCCAFSYDPFGDKMSSTEVIFEKWPHNLCEPRQWSCFSWGINFTDPCLCFKHLRLMCDISLWRFSSDNHKYLKAYPHLKNAFLEKLPEIYMYILKNNIGMITASNETSNAISAPPPHSNRFDV